MDEKSVWRLFVMRKYKTANTTLITIQKNMKNSFLLLLSKNMWVKSFDKQEKNRMIDIRL